MVGVGGCAVGEPGGMTGSRLREGEAGVPAGGIANEGDEAGDSDEGISVFDGCGEAGGGVITGPLGCEGGACATTKTSALSESIPKHAINPNTMQRPRLLLWKNLLFLI